MSGGVRVVVLVVFVVCVSGVDCGPWYFSGALLMNPILRTYTKRNVLQV